MAMRLVRLAGLVDEVNVPGFCRFGCQWWILATKQCCHRGQLWRWIWLLYDATPGHCRRVRLNSGNSLCLLLLFDFILDETSPVRHGTEQAVLFLT